MLPRIKTSAMVLCLGLPLLVLNSQARASQSSGKETFVTYCSNCHGIDGRGGEHAPNIATQPAIRRLSDAGLLKILRNGIPSAGMPSFSALGSGRLKVILDYVRVLQGTQATASFSGNAALGRKLFFGAVACSSCHMVHGVGGFLGPDLSAYSLSHSPEEIRQAILSPNKRLSRGSDAVVAITRDGQRFVGVARNEDNFSLQLQTPDGNFHLLQKSDLVALRHEPLSLMPSNYRSRLSDADIRDLVSFLVKSGGGQ
jgi:cytochrome c oxidase cbb3-type subunit III